MTYGGKNYDVYYVQSYVDSENAMGAMVRTNYVVKIGLLSENPKSDEYYYEIESSD
jgi:hypothetical protein